jgi:hypothetical protein
VSLWLRQKGEAQLAVHRQFAIPATYTPPSVGASPVVVYVRHHTRVAVYGDLDREGFAQTVDDVNAITFDTCEVMPEKRGVVEFDDGRRYKVETVQPQIGRFVRCDVAGLRSA